MITVGSTATITTGSVFTIAGVGGTTTAGQAAAFFLSLELGFPDPAGQKKYRALVGRPVFFGDVIGGIVGGRYAAAKEAADDLALMAENTRVYWAAQVVWHGTACPLVSICCCAVVAYSLRFM